jgi:NAD+ kinase
MEHFFIITNLSKDKDLVETKYIKKLLEDKGKTCELAEYHDEARNDTGLDNRAYKTHVPDDVDCCIVLGGDGTMLQAARNVVDRDIPILGVNLGTLGYLAEVEKNSVDGAIEKIIDGNYEIEDRMMLYGKINGQESDYALNDIVIARGSSIQVINLNIYVNGMFLNSYHADGVIISTPTGSTGYNMSAGGPIVEPSAQMILMTPICPHTINARSIILSQNDNVVVEIGQGRGGSELAVEATFDGSNCHILKTGDRIEIKKSSKSTKILKLNKVSFLEALHSKLS